MMRWQLRYYIFLTVQISQVASKHLSFDAFIRAGTAGAFIFDQLQEFWEALCYMNLNVECRFHD